MRGSSEKGFTLLEVLLAVGLFVVVISAVYGTFFVADRAYRVYRDYGVRLQQLRTVMALLERELQSSYYNEKDPFSGFYLKTKDYYDRRLSDVEFTTVEGPQPPLRIRYFVKEEGERLTLYKTVTTLDGKEMTFPVIEGLHYFTVTDNEGGKALEVYDARKTHRLPRALRVSVGIIYNGDLMEFSMTVSPYSEVFKW
jgi:prepilin-type N-terminal cleavage/methylation domain-containing protein